MVRFAKPEDIPFLKQAWEVCFEDPKAFIDWNFAENFSCADTLIAEADGVPASNLQLMPHRIQLGRFTYDINYVSGVATLPQFRNRGLVRELFTFAFPVMQEREQPISLLVPFDYGFYEKFGYRKCYNKTYFYADTLPERNYLKDLSEELIESLDRIYRIEMQNRNGYALRTPLDWRKILTDLLLLSEGSVLLEPEGYALIAPRKEGGFEIHEKCGKCSLNLRQEEKPFAMARIVDARRLLADSAEDFDRSVRLRIQDSQIPENNFTCRIANGTLTPCEEFDISLDIKELAPLLFASGKEPYLNMIF